MQIDLKSRKTEAEWRSTFSSFFLKATPLWFDWLGWLLVLGAITYLSDKTGSMILRGIEIISFVLLFMYFMFFMEAIEIKGGPQIATARYSRLFQIGRLIVSMAVSTLLVLGIMFMLLHVIDLLRKAGV